MKEEIKEILDSIQEHLKENEENFKKGAVDSTVYYLYCDDARILLDYITNLQEESERLAKDIGLWNGLYNIEFDKAIKYKSKNEKAIKCIKDKYYKEEYERIGTFANKLMNILQGEDKK